MCISLLCTYTLVIAAYFELIGVGTMLAAVGHFSSVRSVQISVCSVAGLIPSTEHKPVKLRTYLQKHVGNGGETFYKRIPSYYIDCLLGYTDCIAKFCSS